MKTTKLNIIFFTFAFSLFTFSLSFAQVSFKNGTDNVLLQVNDYGATGTVTLPPFAIFPTLPINSNMLLNFDGTLYWNGSALGTSNNAGGWTHSGTKIYNTTLTDNVGIGTNNPQSKLSVGGDGIANATISATATSNISRAVYGIANADAPYTSYGGWFETSSENGRGVYGRSNGDNGRAVYGYSPGPNGKGIYGEANGTDAYAGYFIGRGYFSENVGIGTENPLAKLSVGGEGVLGASIYGESTSGAGVYGYATLPGGFGGVFTTSADNTIGISASASGVNSFAGYFTGRGYFSGNVGIGESSPSYKLHVKDDKSNNFVARIENTSIGTDADGLAILLNVGTPASSNHFIRFQKSGGAGIGSIDGSGSQVFYNTTSDARLKMNIKEFSNALETLSRVGIKKYERISNPGIEEIGVIAQELQKVYPQAVSGSPDSDVKTDPMMVDYSKLTPLLVKAVQEQQETIKTQESTIKELENRLGKIESLLDGKRFTSVNN